MEREFAEKNLFITGATSGIGRATALRFAQAGANIAAVGRDEAELKNLERALSELSVRCVMISADLAQDDSVDTALAKALDVFGGLDILVNAAGHISNGTIETTRVEAWDAMLNINLRSVFLLMQKALPTLSERRGNIVNVSSVTGLRAFPGVLAYCVSKAGLDQLTRCAALELAAQGVRVNAVNPGVVITEIHKRGGMSNDQYADFLEHSRGTHPLGRVGKPEEIAELIAFLASERASWVTGATYSIDGGRAQTCAR
ncbi:MAG TPA: SDR family oxidoreductase [Pyrinomonadaceae bacterium]|nr:SDR family oxidoreductase [Pyrinomonadaceae bacterium]